MLSLLEGVFLGFLRRMMGCFFGCFRIRDDTTRRRPQSHRLVSQPPAAVPPKSGERLPCRTPLSDLLLDKEKDGFPEVENPQLATPQQGTDERLLKDEARFLKACGTLPETPAEIRKAPEKFTDTSTYDADLQPSKFHSWLPNTPIEKLNLETQPDLPPTPIQLSEAWVKGSVSLELSPESSISNSHNSGSISVQGSSAENSSLTTMDIAANGQSRNKYVRFESDNDVNSFSSGSSSTGTAGQNSKQYGTPGNYSLSKPSPYPTPLNLTDGMQTPGTVFPSYNQNMENAKNPRIRSQYVYSVLNPVESFSQWNVLKEEDAIEPSNVTTEPEEGMTETSVEKELKVESSLSSWLKPLPTKENDSTHQSGSISFGKAHIGRTPADRPIIGMVAAHWNEEEPSRISPKYWDGNGIPNSTNKYKEDQRVSWHATPFEERLEKALSDETSVPQRKHINAAAPIVFEETEESDTALSQLQSSNHSNPVVSF
ncbi:protein JASON-like isoform X1 [Rhododendron vialii]|uniref:protein JASON-like isoform X1 n=1 Tax=Rhododendron vialii TaxID=182163 RepID=UPI00265E525C|nr:protein JASON-like isoform X1 [Rhododendron vialii]XP_058216273.1 protein JASON-like isoform X1 [Rhododendron vialii]